MFGKSPSEYLGIISPHAKFAVDFACFCAHCEDENYHYEQSKHSADKQAVEIGDVLENYRRQIGERG
jgi:hypothetical protein